MFRRSSSFLPIACEVLLTFFSRLVVCASGDVVGSCCSFCCWAVSASAGVTTVEAAIRCWFTSSGNRSIRVVCFITGLLMMMLELMMMVEARPRHGQGAPVATRAQTGQPALEVHDQFVDGEGGRVRLFRLAPCSVVAHFSLGSSAVSGDGVRVGHVSAVCSERTPPGTTVVPCWRRPPALGSVVPHAMSGRPVATVQKIHTAF